MFKAHRNLNFLSMPILFSIALYIGVWFFNRQVASLSESLLSWHVPYFYYMSVFSTTLFVFFLLLIFIVFLSRKNSIDPLLLSICFLPLLGTGHFFSLQQSVLLSFSFVLIFIVSIIRLRDVKCFLLAHSEWIMVVLALFSIDFIFNGYFSPLHFSSIMADNASPFSQLPIISPLFKSYILAKQYVFSNFDTSAWGGIGAVPTSYQSVPMELFALLFKLPSLSIKSFEILLSGWVFFLSLLGSVGFYVYLRKVCGIRWWLSFLGGVLFLFGSHNFQILLSGDSFIILSSYFSLPWAMYFLCRAFAEKKISYYVGLSLSLCLPFLVLSPHPDAASLSFFLVFCVIFTLIIFKIHSKGFKKSLSYMAYICAAAFLCILLSAFYFYPIFSEIRQGIAIFYGHSKAYAGGSVFYRFFILIFLLWFSVFERNCFNMLKVLRRSVSLNLEPSPRRMARSHQRKLTLKRFESRLVDTGILGLVIAFFGLGLLYETSLAGFLMRSGWPIPSGAPWRLLLFYDFIFWTSVLFFLNLCVTQVLHWYCAFSSRWSGMWCFRKENILKCFCAGVLVVVFLSFNGFYPLVDKDKSPATPDCNYYVSLASKLVNYQGLSSDQDNVEFFRQRLLRFVSSAKKSDAYFYLNKFNQVLRKAGIDNIRYANNFQIIELVRHSSALIDRFYMDENFSCQNSYLRNPKFFTIQYNIDAMFDQGISKFSRIQFFSNGIESLGLGTGLLMNNNTTIFDPRFMVAYPTLHAVYLAPSLILGKMGGYSSVFVQWSLSKNMLDNQVNRRLFDISGIDYFVIKSSVSQGKQGGFLERLKNEYTIIKNPSSYGVVYIATSVRHLSGSIVKHAKGTVMDYFRNKVSLSRYKGEVIHLRDMLLKLKSKGSVLLSTDDKSHSSLGFFGEGKAKIEKFLGPNAVIKTHCSSKQCLLVFNMAELPGWKVYVNQKFKKILNVNLAFMGVVVPKGHATVWFSYRPLSVFIGSLLTLLGLIISIFLLRNPFKKSDEA